MDNLTHSLVGLTLAKAGLDRASPGAVTVCVLAANAADSDVVTLFTGGRWSVLQNHRGITHSIAGTVLIGLLIPTLFWIGEVAIARMWRRPRRIVYPGLLLASMIAAATHPLMDWTNNYGVRLLLPWSPKWFYGDLVFIVDPYIWLVLGAVSFLLTSGSRLKLTAWLALAIVVTGVVFVGPSQRGGLVDPTVMRVFWLAGLIVAGVARGIGVGKGAGNRLGSRLAFGSLIAVGLYCGALSELHHLAYEQAVAVGNEVAAPLDERVINMAAMPTLGNPLRWQCIVETDRALYRFFVDVNHPGDPEVNNGGGATNSANAIQRFEKPINGDHQLVSIASQDPRATVLLNFARFPLAQVKDHDCVGQTLVQFADLRFTEPTAAPRGNFSLAVPVACPDK
jgi:inner membrane protein